jgi:tetratricopeptide (TPR) repeat protein
LKLALALPASVKTGSENVEAKYKKKKNSLVVIMQRVNPLAVESPEAVEAKRLAADTAAAEVEAVRVKTEKNIALAEEHKTKGNSLLGQQQYEEAVDCYTEAIAINETAVYFSNRAMAYTKLNELELAIDDATSAITLDPAYVKAYYRRGSAHQEDSNWDDAIADFEKAVQLAPGNKEARSQLMSCKLELNREETERLARQNMMRLNERETACSAVARVVDRLAVDKSYAGPHLPGAGVTHEFMVDMMAHLKAQRILHKKYAIQVSECRRHWWLLLCVYCRCADARARSDSRSLTTHQRSRPPPTLLFLAFLGPCRSCCR